MKLLVATLLLAACGGAQVKELPAVATPYCFRIDVKVFGAAEVCTARPVLCARARDKAITFSGIAGFKTVGACRHVDF